MAIERNKVRVFTSAAFNEMADERNSLVMHVFPELREVCTEHGVVLDPIDLRWGIASEGVENVNILDISKSELNRAAIMIAIIGDTFGWVPENEYDSTLALEMYTALSNPAITLLAFQPTTEYPNKLVGGADNDPQIQEEIYNLEQKKLVRRLEHLGVEIAPYSSIEEFKSLVSGRLGSVLKEAYFAKLGNVFISYSRKDIELAENARRLLEGLGFNVWLDLQGIGAGEEWPAKLAAAINGCDVVLMLISDASVTSDYCLKEIVFAHKKEKPIIGLRLGGVELPDEVDFMLGDVQQIMLAEPDRIDQVVVEISDGLKKQVEISRSA